MATAPAAKLKLLATTVLVLAAHALPAPRAPWTIAEFPHPGNAPASCGTNHRNGPVTFLCDPEELLEASVREDETQRVERIIKAFEDEFGASHFGSFWGSRIGIALLHEAKGSLQTFAEAIADKWGLTGQGDAVLVLELSSRPRAYLAGGFLAESKRDERSASSWKVAAEDRAGLLLRAGRIADAIEGGLSGVAEALGSGVLEAVQRVRQPVRVFKEHSDYQLVEVEETACGGRRCRQFVLDRQVTLSDRFQRYFHEAMTMVPLNALGSAAKDVLVIGGGDGGVATLVSQYSTVKKVTIVDIDDIVTAASRQWFPAMSAGIGDSRVSVVRDDAISWMMQCKDTFDLVVVDFTQEPLEHFWSTEVFTAMKKLVKPAGALVHSVGTMASSQELRRKFALHASVFAKVYPMSAYIPDLDSPYILALSSDKMDPLAVDWKAWEQQGITPTYYSPALHKSLFAVPAEVSRLLGVKAPMFPGQAPGTVAKDLEAVASQDERLGGGAVLLRRTASTLNDVKIVQEGATAKLVVNKESVLSRFSGYREEAMALPTLNLLGSSAERVLVLGGGDGALAAWVLKYPSVKELVIIEVDSAVVDTVKKASTWFPDQAASLSDPRTTLVLEDVLEWLQRADGSVGKFDAVLMSLEHQPWLEASRISRVPRTFSFLRRLRSLLKPDGLLVQDIGSIASPQNVQRLLTLHRATFKTVLPMAFGTLEDRINDASERRVRQGPRLLALSSPGDIKPLVVDWKAWGELNLQTQYYNPALHEALFVLPAELQRQFAAEAAKGAEVAGPAGDAASSDDDGALVFGFFIEAHGCGFDALNDTAGGLALLEDLAQIGHLTYVNGMGHQFLPQGFTALLLVEESHLSIHTWPELGYTVLDIVSCKAMNAEMQRGFAEATRARLGCREVAHELRLRGYGYGREGGFKPVPAVEAGGTGKAEL
eukprot:TRINITY_DN9547_c0_g1_i1.p1 TRINITY_DN9547_c0_g1~~TRINITY_DN9547_c0_g1_i1.p1  ORF type:complete len:938 (-),score=238.01 TRINITY_DN9547_c0_g1_i1:515-3328(-)